MQGRGGGLQEAESVEFRREDPHGCAPQSLWEWAKRTKASSLTQVGPQFSRGWLGHTLGSHPIWEGNFLLRQGQL